MTAVTRRRGPVDALPGSGGGMTAVTRRFPPFPLALSLSKGEALRAMP